MSAHRRFSLSWAKTRGRRQGTRRDHHPAGLLIGFPASDPAPRLGRWCFRAGCAALWLGRALPELTFPTLCPNNPASATVPPNARRRRAALGDSRLRQRRGGAYVGRGEALFRAPQRQTRTASPLGPPPYQPHHYTLWELTSTQPGAAKPRPKAIHKSPASAPSTATSAIRELFAIRFA